MRNLKQIRESNKLTASKLSELSGVNIQMIQKYEMGVKDINKAQGMTIYKLSKVLNCNMENLLELREPE